MFFEPKKIIQRFKMYNECMPFVIFYPLRPYYVVLNFKGSLCCDSVAFVKTIENLEGIYLIGFSTSPYNVFVLTYYTFNCVFIFMVCAIL